MFTEACGHDSGGHDVAIELVPLAELEVVLDEPIVVGDGPAGLRMIFEVLEATVTGERLQGVLKGRAAADWLLVQGTVGTIDVRATLETHDGAVILSSYRGRTDLSGGPDESPVYVAPTFETGDERYAWLNRIVAVGKGVLDGSILRYEWYEVR
jgi:hypothetical protein